MLTSAAARAARPGSRAYKRADGAGLFLEVRPTGTKIWRMRWRDPGGREQLLTIGHFPTVSIDAARAQRDTARAAIAAGVDPRNIADLQFSNFETAARAWHAHRALGWSAAHAGDVLDSLERDVFPAIGASSLDSITRPQVLVMLKRIEERGAIATARRVRQRIEMAFAFARAKGWTSADNPADVGEALANAPAEGRQLALVDLAEIRALLAAVDQLAAAPALKLASRFLALTAVRLAALRGMTWDEVEGLDGPAPLWRVPASRMKLKAVHKLDAARDHLVPLAAAAVAVLRQARNMHRGDANMHGDHFVGAGKMVFPGRDGTAPIGAGAIGELYARAGFAGQHVPHGWRASFSTVMNERRPADRGAIDRALGHQPKGMTKVEKAYNRAQHLDQRRAILEEWAELIAP